MKSTLSSSDSRLVGLQVLMVSLLLGLAAVEMTLAPPQLIQQANTAWALDHAADSAYGMRVLLLLVNMVGATIVGILAFQVGRRHAAIGEDGVAFSIGLAVLAAVKAWMWTPFWVNGVPATLALLPRPDMDPKALLPALWFPNAALWQLVVFVSLVSLYIAIPFVLVLTLRGAWRHQRWHMALLSPLPLLLAIALLWGTPGLGMWLGD